MSNQSRNEFGGRAFPISDIFQIKIIHILHQPEIYHKTSTAITGTLLNKYTKGIWSKFPHKITPVNSEKATGP